MHSYSVLTAHIDEELQLLFTTIDEACNDFGLEISHDGVGIPKMFIGDHTFQMVDHSTNLWSNIVSIFSLDCELNIRIGQASDAVTPHTERVACDVMLIVGNAMEVYQHCALSTRIHK